MDKIGIMEKEALMVVVEDQCGVHLMGRVVVMPLVVVVQLIFEVMLMI